MAVIGPASAISNASAQRPVVQKCMKRDNVHAVSAQIIETKVKKLEQLVRLKDAKIQTLISKMQAAGLA